MQSRHRGGSSDGVVPALMLFHALVVAVVAQAAASTPPPPPPAPAPLTAPASDSPAATAPAPTSTPPGLPKADVKTAGLDGVVLKAAQLGACGGVYVVASAVSCVVSYIPIVGGVLGCALCLVMPAVYGATVTGVGNKLSNRQAPLLWPTVTMYTGAAITTALSIVAFIVPLVAVVGVGVLNPAAIVSGGPTALIALYIALALPIGAAIVTSVLGFVATGVVSTFVWDANAVGKDHAEQFEMALVDMKSPFYGAPPPAPSAAKPAAPSAPTPSTTPSPSPVARLSSSTSLARMVY